jgi:hypothetical protein
MATGQDKSNVSTEMAMIGIAWERESWTKRAAVECWLTETFGSSTPTTWYLEQDYDLLGLVMNESVAVMYYLKWS